MSTDETPLLAVALTHDPRSPVILQPSGSPVSHLPTPQAMSLTPPAASRLQALARLRSTVLQRPYNPLGLRTGVAYLQKPLIGPTINSWYPLKMTDRMTRRILGLGNDWHNEDTQRVVDKWDDLHAKGKFAVKKGQSLCSSSVSGACAAARRALAATTRALKRPLPFPLTRSGQACQAARQEGWWKEVGGLGERLGQERGERELVGRSRCRLGFARGRGRRLVGAEWDGRGGWRADALAAAAARTAMYRSFPSPGPVCSRSLITRKWTAVLSRFCKSQVHY